MPFWKSFSGAKMKAHLDMAKERFGIVQGKKQNEIRTEKRSVAEDLRKKEYDMARIRVEGVLRKIRENEAFEILRLHCALLRERIPLIQSEKQCPIDLLEAVHTVVWAAPRCMIEELRVVQEQLVLKYGEQFFAASRRADGTSPTPVNERVRVRLTAAVPSDEVKIECLTAIAKEFNVDDFDACRDFAISKVGLLPMQSCADPASAVPGGSCTQCEEKHHDRGGGGGGGSSEGFFPPPGYNGGGAGGMPPMQQQMQPMQPGAGPQPISFFNMKTGEPLPGPGYGMAPQMPPQMPPQGASYPMGMNPGGQNIPMGIPVGLDALSSGHSMGQGQAMFPAHAPSSEYEAAKMKGYDTAGLSAGSPPVSSAPGTSAGSTSAAIDPAYLYQQQPTQMPPAGHPEGAPSSVARDAAARLAALKK